MERRSDSMNWNVYHRAEPDPLYQGIYGTGVAPDRRKFLHGWSAWWTDGLNGVGVMYCISEGPVGASDGTLVGSRNKTESRQ
jgi:hypothetical protein